MLALYGYRYSVYAWIARFALHEKGLGYDWIEVDPFSAPGAEYMALNPFGRVPTLVDDSFALYETGAVTRYVDEAFDGPPLQPTGARERARMAQIMSIVDSYAYWPWVRQVFSHAVFRPRIGEPADPDTVTRGLAGSEGALDALERLAGEGPWLGGAFGLADIHLAPMAAYFRAADEGRQAFEARPALSAWFRGVSDRPAFRETTPALPGHDDA